MVGETSNVSEPQSVNLKVSSYNCKHFSASKLPFITELYNECTFLLLQEHCLFESRFDEFCSISKDISYCGCSAMNENQILTGRPYGGCAILWKSNLDFTITRIECTSKRICGVLVTYNENISILILNTYMPCDERCAGTNLEEYAEVIEEVECIIHKLDCTYVIFGGDFNVDFRRRSPHTDLLSRFIYDAEFSCAGNYDNFPYTFSTKDGKNTSIIDYVFVSDNFKEHVKSYYIHDGADNMSDHVAVVCECNFIISYVCIDKYETIGEKRCKWGDASVREIERYRSYLDQLLSNIKVSNDMLNCTNTQCTEHFTHIDNLYQGIVNSCIEAGEKCIPQSDTKSNKDKRRAHFYGWSEFVEPERQTAMLWHDIWKSVGCPGQGIVSNIRRQTRTKYHQAVKWVKRNNMKLKHIAIAESMVEHNDKVFWTEVKKLKRSHRSVPRHIDGITGDQNIANHFADQFCSLYNSVPYVKPELESIIRDINQDILSGSCSCNSCASHRLYVTSTDIEMAVKDLKPGKRDGVLNLFTNHLKYGTARLHLLLAMLFSCMVTHHYSPGDMIHGVMIPLPKVKGTVKSDNFRAITLSHIFSKLLDVVILHKCKEKLETCDLQFGFKKKSSTTNCTFIVQETVSLYNRQGSDVYCCLLDASKAFDRLEYVHLFGKLRSRNLCPKLLHLIVYMYINQTLAVKWNSSISETFHVSNGVKQGSVISPILFCIYIEGLLYELQKEGIGCYIGDNYCGAVAYADDITLLCPSIRGMRKMLNICTVYAAEHSIKFNAKKSKLLIFPCKKGSNINVSLTISGESIDVINRDKHLGHMLGNENGGLVDAQYISAALAKSVNILLGTFGSAPSSILSKLFKQYCTSFYGIVLCDMRSMAYNGFCVTWRKAVRRILKLPYRTHSRYLSHIMQQMPLNVTIACRIVKFFLNAVSSKNVLVQNCAKRCLYHSSSNMAKNIRYIDKLCNFVQKLDVTNICADEIVDHVRSQMCCSHGNLCDNDNYYVNVISECIDLRDRTLYTCDVLSAEEYCQLLECLCTI